MDKIDEMLALPTFSDPKLKVIMVSDWKLFAQIFELLYRQQQEKDKCSLT